MPSTHLSISDVTWHLNCLQMQFTALLASSGIFEASCSELHCKNIFLSLSINFHWTFSLRGSFIPIKRVSNLSLDCKTMGGLLNLKIRVHTYTVNENHQNCLTFIFTPNSPKWDFWRKNSNCPYIEGMLQFWRFV